MIPAFHRLIDALRSELQQYGEALALLDSQVELTTRPMAGNSSGTLSRLPSLSGPHSGAPSDFVPASASVPAPGVVPCFRGAMDNYGQALAAIRRRRSAIERQIERQLPCADDAPIQELLPAHAGDYAPLIFALAEENAELVMRVRERARRHETLFCQSLERMHRLLAGLNSEDPTTQKINEATPTATEPTAPLTPLPFTEQPPTLPC